MKVKLISVPEKRETRKNIVKQELKISRQIAKMVFDLNSIVFTECWVSFWAGHVRWDTCEPSPYYVQHSYHYRKEE